MKQQEKHIAVVQAIDEQLRANHEFSEVAMRPDGRGYTPWYAKYLTAVALISAGQEVIYAHTDLTYGATRTRLVVLTMSLVVVTDVDLREDTTPVAHVVSRKALKSIRLRASEPFDASDRRRHEWPGKLELELKYSGVADAIVIQAHGANPYALNEPSPISTIIESLSDDLHSVSSASDE